MAGGDERHPAADEGGVQGAWADAERASGVCAGDMGGERARGWAAAAGAGQGHGEDADDGGRIMHERVAGQG